MAQAKRDENYVPTLLAVSSVDGTTPVTLYADPTTHRLYVDLAGGGGMVYPGAGIAVSTGAAWDTSITDNHTNWDTAYTNRITSLTTTGNSGSSTLIANTLNVPTYTLTGLGGGTWATLNYPTYVSGTPFVKMTSAGTFSLDTNTYATTGSATTSGLTMSTARILGRTTASSGAIEEITVGSGLSLSAGSLTATGSGGATTSKAINQTAHGFAVNDVIKFSGTSYAKAKADSAANAEVVGVVTTVTDADNFTFTMEGYATLGTLTSDTTYFLSDATAGLLTATEPTSVGSISKPVLKTVSTTAGIINNMRGMEITASGNYVTVATGKTSSVSNSITFAGTDSTTMTFPSTSASVARTDAAQTFTGTQTFSNAVINTNNAITASGNAATVPVTAKLNTVTNNSAATLTITMATASAVDGQMTIVRVLDFSAAAQTITWVNTEDSTVAAPTTSNGSTTLFLTVGFIYNNATSKWRCIAKA